MVEPFAVPDDVADRWRPLTPSEATRAVTLIEDASTEIRAAFRREDLTAEGQVAAGEITSEDLRVVVCRMVKRALLAPVDQAPMTNYQETTGPFSESGTFVNPTGDVYLTKADRRMLGLGGQVAFTVSMAAPTPEYDPLWFLR